MADTPTPQEFNIRDYWQILVRRRWLIYTFVLITTVAAGVSSFVATPTYKATCTISIERSPVRLMKQELVSSEPSWLDYQNFYNTQYKILESDRVLQKVAKDLRLSVRGIPGESADKTPSTLAAFKAQVLGVLGRAPRAEDRDEEYRHLKFLHGGVSVDPVRDSHLVLISFVSTDRQFAADAANAVAEAYSTFTLESKLDLATASEKFFSSRSDDLQKEITKSEAELQAFARVNNLVTGDNDEAALKNYSDLRTKLSQAQADLAQAQARYQAYQQGSPESLDEVRQNSHLMDLASQVALAEGQYRELEGKFDSQYPEVVSARSKMDGLRNTLKVDTDRVAKQTIEAARIDYQNRLNQVQNLTRLYEQSRSIVDRFQGPYAEYLTKKRIVEAKRTTLNELLDKQNTMAISANMGENVGHNVRIIDSARTPRQIYKPKKKLNIMLGLLAGLVLGVAGAVVLEYVDNTLKTPDDIRQVLGLAVLGMIPAQEAAAKERPKKPAKPKKSVRVADAAGPARDVDPALVTLQSPLSPTAEAYRELRTAILLATPGHPPRDLTVTSCQPSEGKTTTAINTAIALAQLGRRVLVVDTDLRRPRCHQVLRAPASRGVSTYLTGNADLRGLIIPTSAERVYLLPAGPIPPNPAELLDADRFRQMVEELRANQDFDHVIYDSPPTLSVVDPLLIGRHTEGTVLVIKSGFTSRESGRLGKEKLLAGRLNLLGVLLNAVSTEHVPYQYRYYRYGYSRKEGEEPTETTETADTGSARGA